MVVQCKKGELFVTGKVFLLDIGLLMGATIGSNLQVGIYCMLHLVVSTFRSSQQWISIAVMLTFGGKKRPQYLDISKKKAKPKPCLLENLNR